MDGWMDGCMDGLITNMMSMCQINLLIQSSSGTALSLISSEVRHFSEKVNLGKALASPGALADS